MTIFFDFSEGNIGDSLDINVDSKVTTKQQEGDMENEKQRNKDEQESKGTEPEVKYFFILSIFFILFGFFREYIEE